MYVNQLTKETYINRKEAKISLGTSNFNRLLKNEIICFINDQPFANYGIQNNTGKPSHRAYNK